MGPVSLSADRRSLFVPKELGLARFDTNRRAFVEFLPGLVECADRVIASPSGLLWYALKTPSSSSQGRLRIIDAVSRAILTDTPSSPVVDVTFGPDGRRYEVHRVTATPVQFEVRAFANETATTPTWQQALDSGASSLELVASNSAMFVLIHDPTPPFKSEVVRLDADMGGENGRIRPMDAFGAEMLVQGISLTGSRIYVAGRDAGRTTMYRASLDIETLGSPVLVNGGPSQPEIDVDIVTADDGAAGYHILRKCGFIRPLHCAVVVDVVDLVSLASEAARSFVASLNPSLWTLGQIAEPLPPRVTRLSTEGRRIAVAWEPSAAGAPARQFVIRGRVRGQTESFTLATLAGSERNWTSGALPPGEYAIELVAVNSVGQSVPAHVDVGIETTGTSQMPESLKAFTAGRSTARLTWAPPAAGPLPSGYAIEAAPSGGAFAAVLTTSLPELAATGIPTGSWQVRVRAITTEGVGPPSAVVDLTSSTCVATTDGPQSLAASVDGPRVTLQWQAPASGPPVLYRLVVSSDGGGNNVIATLPVTGATTSFEVDAPPGVYVVRVIAESPCATATPSNPVVVRVP